MAVTNISWTAWRDRHGFWQPGYTFNPWWGCMKVSAGCTNCYAEGQAKRYGHDIWGPASNTPRRLFGERHWAAPLVWNRQAQEAGDRRRVFCASFADVFEDHPMVVAERAKLWPLIAATPNLDWLLLTKRPENFMDAEQMLPFGYLPNVWLGTSTENQEQAEARIPFLVAVRSKVPVLFLSIEPQLGPVDLTQWIGDGTPDSHARVTFQNEKPIDWVITGGESGPHHRPFEEDWARLTRDQCAAAGVSWHYKQLGGLHHADGGCLLDGREHKEFPTPLLPVPA